LPFAAHLPRNRNETVTYPVTATAVGTAVGAGAAAAGPGAAVVVVVDVTAAAVTVIEKGFEAVLAGAESLTDTVKLKVPTVVHVPVIAPVDALMLSIGGSEPLLIDHV
jgi:hypothetical protein